MILGYALRKFARELGIEKHRGVACGIYKNYPVSMWEGIASKSFCISGQFDAETRKTVESRLSDIDLFAYRVLFYDIEDMWIYFHFEDNPGTMERFREIFFLLVSILDECSISSPDICPKCRHSMNGQGLWSCLDLGLYKVCLYIHEDCLASVEQVLNQKKTLYQEQERNRRIAEEQFSSGSCGRGWTGALGGGILGIVIMIILYIVGDTLSALGGMLTGYLVIKGYHMANGAPGKKRAAVIISISIICVLLGGILAPAVHAGMLLYGAVPSGFSNESIWALYLNSLRGYMITYDDTVVRVIAGSLFFLLFPMISPFIELVSKKRSAEIHWKKIR